MSKPAAIQRNLSRQEEARLMHENRGLVFNEARRFSAMVRPDMRPDLIQEGMVGLLKGIRRFDPERGFALSTYVAHWIRTHLRNWVSENKRLITNSGASHNLSQVLKAKRELERAGIEPTVPAIEKAMAKFHFGAERIRAYLAWHELTECSLDAPCGEDGTSTLQDFLAGPSLNPEAIIDLRKMFAQFDRAVSEFEGLLDTERERRVFRESVMSKTSTLTALGKRYRVTRERIRQIRVGIERRFEKALKLRFGVEVSLRGLRRTG